MARRLTTCTGIALTLLAISGCVGGGARSSGGASRAGSGSGAALAAPDSAMLTGAVRMRAVALYRSGVGFFEQGGTVDGDATTAISMPRAQVDDLLKSLVAEDAEGAVRGLDFDTPEAPDDAGYAVDLRTNDTLVDLLRALRGTQVTVTMDGQDLGGAILGVDLIVSNAPGQAEVPRAWLTLLSGAVARQVPLDAVAHLRFADARLADEMAAQLATMAARRGTHQAVALRWHGVGSRAVRFAYAAEAPMWKASYRLVMPDLGADGARVARLLGYAVVENETDADWQGVRLDLMTGRPVSFIERLADPIHLVRPTLVRPREAVAPPPTDRGGLRGAALMAAPTAQEQSRLEDDSKRDEDDALAKSLGTAGDRRSAPTGQGVASAAEGGAMGELYDYRLAAPVSIARGHAALVPFLVGEVTCERVSILDASVLEGHPLAGALLTNTSGGPLPQGPLTVIDGGDYGGDASLSDLPSGEHRLISYAVDLPVRTIRSVASDARRLVSATIVGGVATIRYAQRSVTTVEIEVTDGRARTLIVQEPLPADALLMDTPAPFEHVGALGRWRLTAPPGHTRFAITVDRVLAEETATLDLHELADEASAYWSAEGRLPKRVHDAFVQLAALRRSLAESEHALEQLAAGRAQRVADQARLRADMGAARTQGPYAQRVLAKLMAEDAEIDQLDAQRQALEAERDARKTALEAFVGSLDLR